MNAMRMRVWIGTLMVASALAGAAEREHGAHVHGEAILDVALDNDQLQIHLDAPGASLIGFEHPPANAEERAALQFAHSVLQAPPRWLLPNRSAGCRAQPPTVEANGFDTAGTPKAGSSEGHEHADFDVDLTYRCEHPESLKTIDVMLFEPFPYLQKVIVNLALPNRQDRQVLNAGPAKIRINP